MITAIFSRLAILVFGTLYPAYASYKAVRTKNVKEYVKWMMYWIVFAFFTCLETFTDIFLSWLPLYYEVKVIVVLWLLNPATKGSSVLYRKFVHPMLTRREQEIDEYLNQAKERGYTAVIQLGSKGVNYATNVIMQTALKTFNQNAIPLNQRGLLTSRSENSLSSEITTRSVNENLDRPDGIRPQNIKFVRSHSFDAPSRTSIFEFNQEYLYQGSSDEDHLTVESYDEFNEDLNQVLEPIPSTSQEGGAARSRILPKRKTRSASVQTKSTKQQSISKDDDLNKKQLSNGSVNRYPVKGRRRLRDTSDFDIDIIE